MKDKDELNTDELNGHGNDGLVTARSEWTESMTLYITAKGEWTSM